MYGEPYRVSKQSPLHDQGQPKTGGGRGAPPDPRRWVIELGNNYLFIKYTKIT